MSERQISELKEAIVNEVIEDLEELFELCEDDGGTLGFVVNRIKEMKENLQIIEDKRSE